MKIQIAKSNCREFYSDLLQNQFNPVELQINKNIGYTQMICMVLQTENYNFTQIAIPSNSFIPTVGKIVALTSVHVDKKLLNRCTPLTFSSG